VETASGQNRAAIALKACDEETVGQKWGTRSTSQGYFGFVSKLGNNKCVDLPGGAATKGMKA